MDGWNWLKHISKTLEIPRYLNIWLKNQRTLIHHVLRLSNHFLFSIIVDLEMFDHFSPKKCLIILNGRYCFILFSPKLGKNYILKSFVPLKYYMIGTWLPSVLVTNQVISRIRKGHVWFVMSHVHHQLGSNSYRYELPGGQNRTSKRF